VVAVHVEGGHARRVPSHGDRHVIWDGKDKTLLNVVFNLDVTLDAEGAIQSARLVSISEAR
jgi:hypothetical protein